MATRLYHSGVDWFVSWVSVAPLDATCCVISTFLVCFDTCDFETGRVALSADEIACRVGYDVREVEWSLEYLAYLGLAEGTLIVERGSPAVSEVELLLDAVAASFDGRVLTRAVRLGFPALQSRAYIAVCEAFSRLMLSRRGCSDAVS